VGRDFLCDKKSLATTLRRNDLNSLRIWILVEPISVFRCVFAPHLRGDTKKSLFHMAKLRRYDLNSLRIWFLVESHLYFVASLRRSEKIIPGKGATTQKRHTDIILVMFSRIPGFSTYIFAPQRLFISVILAYSEFSSPESPKRGI